MGRWPCKHAHVQCITRAPGIALQELGGNATLLFYQTPEGDEGRRAYLEKRPPDFSKFPRYP